LISLEKGAEGPELPAVAPSIVAALADKLEDKADWPRKGAEGT